MDSIFIKGARTHNLKNINLEIPRNKIIVITGLSGSGKTSIAKKIKKEIIKKYGPTIIVSGDNFRKIFKFNRYSFKTQL